MNSNPYLLTLPQLISAKKKIGQVAAFYDPNLYSLSGFDSSSLNPTEFREQLARNFRVFLTDEELGAIVFLFDRDGDGTVDSVEFVTEFFKMGKQERIKMDLAHKDEQVRIEKRKKRLIEDRDQKYFSLSQLKTTDKWTPAEEKEAIRKVAKVAFVYDRSKGGLKEFTTCDSLTPTEFREQMRRNFEVKLTPAETAALIYLFDTDGDGRISCQEFLYRFFRIGRTERDEHFRRQLTLTQKKNQSEKERQERSIQKFVQRTHFHMCDATERDKESGYEKIRQAAMFYVKDNVLNPPLQKSFESAEISASVFRELLKANFQIFLTPGELNAVVTMFDLDSNGFISCPEFLSTFFRISAAEKTRLLEDKKRETEKLLKESRELDEAVVKRLMDRSKTRVKWPVLPPDEPIIDPHHHQHQHHNNQSAAGRLEPLEPASSSSVGVGKPSSARRSKKLTVLEILSPNKSLPHLSRDASFAAMFPKASKETKDFLLSIEQQEKEIKKTKFRLPRSRQNLMNSSTGAAAVDSVDS